MGQIWDFLISVSVHFGSFNLDAKFEIPVLKTCSQRRIRLLERRKELGAQGVATGRGTGSTERWMRVNRDGYEWVTHRLSTIFELKIMIEMH